MSTRGVVAVGTPTKWRGVYNHFDSYPTGLGKDLWEHLYRELLVENRTLQEIADRILSFDDWRNYLKGGVCEYCGKIAGQPHTISCGIGGNPELKTYKDFSEHYLQYPAWQGREAEIKQMWKAEEAVRKNIRNTGYPDPEAKHHQHNSLDAQSEHVTSEDVDSWIEWAYVIEVAANTVHVLAHSNKQFELVASLPIDIKPDWEKVECGELYERCHHYAWYHFPELGRESRLGTAEYLGREQLADLHHVIAFVIKGERVKSGGSGFHSQCLSTLRFGERIAGGKPRNNHWYQSIIHDDGREEMYPVARITKKGYKPARGVTWVFPRTLVNPNETYLPPLKAA